MNPEPKQPETAKGMLPPAYLLLSIAAMIALHFLLPIRHVVSFPWKLLGIPPFLIGGFLNLAADRAFKNLQTTVKPFEESAHLVTTGVYAVSRNPMYLGFVLILLGIALLMGSLTPCAVVLLFAPLMDVIFIRVEEKMMAEKFKQAWLTYRKKTRRWI